MEKQSSPSPAAKRPAADVFNDVLLRMSPPQARQRADKPSRDAISRCINIWAAVYRLRDADSEPAPATDTRELSMPSRTWAGRRAPQIDRFE